MLVSGTKEHEKGQPPVDAPPLSLRRLILRAGGWTMVGHLIGYVLRISSSLIMTRLLVPEMFGVMAIVTVVQVVVALLSDIGLRQAVIHSPRGDSPVLLNTAWTMQVIRGGVIWMVCVLIAFGLHLARVSGWVPAESVYAAPDLAIVLAVASLSAVVMGLQSTKAITCDRNLDLKRVVAIEVYAQIAGLVVMALLGWLTRSIWSFVAGGLVSAVIVVVLSHSWLSGISNRFQWNADAARELIRYGRWVLLSSIFFVLAANGDRMLLGAWVTASVLGLYALALNIASMVEGAGSRLFASVATPALNKVVREQPERLRAVYYKLRMPFDVAFIGSAGVLFATGQVIVDVLYDARYSDAGTMLQVLSFSLLMARYGVTGSLYLAVGEPRNLSVIHFAKMVSIFAFVPLCYHWFGFVGALWAIALHALPTLPLIFYFNRRHGANNFAFEVLILLVWPVGYAAGLLLVSMLAHLMVLT